MSRGTYIQIRASEEEKDAIRARAQAAGYKDVGPYLRDLGLGRKAPSIESPKPEPDPADCHHNHLVQVKGQVNAGECQSCGAIVAINPSRPISPNVAAEIAEAKMLDGEAHDAFLERRTRQLIGMGKTSLLARRLAEQEWEARGAG